MGIATNEMTVAVHEYIRARNEGDREPWLALHTEDSVHEDPVGGSTNDVGIDQIAAHWDVTQALNIELLLDEPVITGGQEATPLCTFAEAQSTTDRTGVGSSCTSCSTTTERSPSSARSTASRVGHVRHSMI